MLVVFFFPPNFFISWALHLLQVKLHFTIGIHTSGLIPQPPLYGTFSTYFFLYILRAFLGEGVPQEPSQVVAADCLPLSQWSGIRHRESWSREAAGLMDRNSNSCIILKCTYSKNMCSWGFWKAVIISTTQWSALVQQVLFYGEIGLIVGSSAAVPRIYQWCYRRTYLAQ